MQTAGQRWKSAREAAGLSAAEAGRLLGVHENTIYKLEKDDEGTTLRMMRRVAAVYGVSLGEIFCEHEDRPERVPVEFRPLLEPLLPMTQQQREQIIRNVAASLSFMSNIYGSVSRAESHATTALSDPNLGTEENDDLEYLAQHKNLTAHMSGVGTVAGERDAAERGPKGPTTRREARRK